MHSPSILIFNGRLLGHSETFVKAQAEGLQKFSPHYAGARLVSGLPLPKGQVSVVNRGGLWGKAKELCFKQTGYAPNFYRKLEAIDPKLIHAHFGVCGTLALPISQALKIPLLVTYHGFDASMTDTYARRNSLTTRVYLRRREQLKRSAAVFIAVSNFIRGRLLEQGFPEHKVKVHYIGIDTDCFQADPSVSRRLQVLFVGRLVEKKGVKYLIQAMAQVQQQLPEVELVIIGDGPLRADLEALAQRKLRNYRFLGLLSSDEVKFQMNQSHLLVAPSVTTIEGDTEGLPMVIVEAQAMGLPVVSTYHAGIPEAVSDGETGFLVAEQDETALVDRILQLLMSNDLWRKFSEMGQHRVHQRFNLKKQIQSLEDIYQDVIDQQL